MSSGSIPGRSTPHIPHFGWDRQLRSPGATQFGGVLVPVGPVDGDMFGKRLVSHRAPTVAPPGCDPGVFHARLVRLGAANVVTSDQKTVPLTARPQPATVPAWTVRTPSTNTSGRRMMPRGSLSSSRRASVSRSSLDRLAARPSGARTRHARPAASARRAAAAGRAGTSASRRRRARPRRAACSIPNLYARSRLAGRTSLQNQASWPPTGAPSSPGSPIPQSSGRNRLSSPPSTTATRPPGRTTVAKSAMAATSSSRWWTTALAWTRSTGRRPSAPLSDCCSRSTRTA